jgi:hypothetical protein
MYISFGRKRSDLSSASGDAYSYAPSFSLLGRQQPFPCYRMTGRETRKDLSYSSVGSPKPSIKLRLQLYFACNKSGLWCGHCVHVTICSSRRKSWSRTPPTSVSPRALIALVRPSPFLSFPIINPSLPLCLLIHLHVCAHDYWWTFL